MNVAAHQEKKAGKRKAEEEKGRPISKKRCAAFLQSFRGQHGEKMVRVRGVSGVTGTLGKTNNHFDPTQTGSGTALPR